jgi:hypothetical protein
MNGTIKKRLLGILFALLTIFSVSIVAVNAAVTMDGTIDEGDWNFWFNDDSEQPAVDVYWATDADYLYIGLVTDDANENKDVLEFAFRADGIDYWIQVKPGIATNYRPSGGEYNGWWSGKKSGLPSGVSIVAGETDGARSYEISIEASILKSELPEKLKFWYKVLDGKSGPDNYYPDSRAGWWFDIERDVGEDDDEKTPIMFSVPEFPLGTLAALVSMVLAFTLFMKKPSFIHLQR